MAARLKEGGELEEAIRLEDGVSFRYLTSLLPHDGNPVEPRRVHDGYVHEASPSRTRS